MNVGTVVLAIIILYVALNLAACALCAARRDETAP